MPALRPKGEEVGGEIGKGDKHLFPLFSVTIEGRRMLVSEIANATCWSVSLPFFILALFLLFVSVALLAN